jgi:hypothetical protein
LFSNTYKSIIGTGNTARNVFNLFPIETPRRIVKLKKDNTFSYHFIESHMSGNTIWGKGMFNNATNIEFKPNFEYIGWKDKKDIMYIN